METGEVSSQFKENGSWIKKDLFVSRADGMIIFKISSERPLLNAEFSVDMISDKGNICFESENVKKIQKNQCVGKCIEIYFGEHRRTYLRCGGENREHRR